MKCNVMKWKFSGNENPLQLSEDVKREEEEIMGLLRQNTLNLNVAKCEYMFLGNKKRFIKISDLGNIEINKDEIKRVDKTKY